MGSDPEPLASRSVSSETGRTFLLNILFFQNGCFITISEGELRVGAVSVAISSSNKANTAKIIPSKHDPIFVNTVVERVASMINGICLVSLHTKVPLQLEDMKAIMGEVMNMIEDRDKGHGGGKEEGAAADGKGRAR